jgi:hypothetical protein
LGNVTPHPLVESIGIVLWLNCGWTNEGR